MLEECANMILECCNRKGKVLIAGNGGSAAQSQHLAAELVGRFKKTRRPISAFALSTVLLLQVLVMISDMRKSFPVS